MDKLMSDIRLESIPEQISNQIKQEIFVGRLKPGDKLPSLDELAETLGVSKPTIREALQMLYEPGLLTITKGRNGGYFVSDVYPDRLMESMYEMITFSLTFNKLHKDDLLEIRKFLEIPFAGLAASRRTPDNIAELKLIADQLKDKDDLGMEELLQLDLKFHLAIADCTQNPLAITIINAITKSFLETTRIKENKVITANSIEVINAIVEGNTKKAEIEMEKHINYFLLGYV